MFKKLKDKIEEEFKQAPLKFPVSVQQLAQVISPSPSVNSLTENNASSSLTYSTDMPNVSTDFFSIGGDDETQDGIPKMQLTLQNVELTATSPSNMTHNMSRSRRSSLSSVTSEASSLFPIYESGLNQNFLQSDLESEMEDGMSGQLDRVSKEQMYQTFKKVLNRYNKYKGRYTDLLKHYKELQHENFKTKNVLQESQDKALRRIAELREQCQLEQKAKAHLEESLRNDVEERDHIIDTLKTKISLLSTGDKNVQLIDLESEQSLNSPGTDSQAMELYHLKSQNEDLQKEVEKLKKIKETACHLIHRCDTTINEATADIQSDNLKRKISELKVEIQKMKSDNENLSHLLSRNLITEDDKKSQGSGDGGTGSGSSSLMADIDRDGEDSSKADDRDKKIEKLNNLLLKCKEKINALTSEIKAKNLIIEDDQKRMKELKEEIDLMKMREEENALAMAENKKAIHEELDAKEKQIKALNKELKAKENEFIKEKDETIKSYEAKIRDLTSDFTKEIKTKTEQNQKLTDDLKAKEIVSGSLDKIKSMEEGFLNLLELVRAKSSAFEAVARTKTNQIESAQRNLEEKMTAVQKRVEALSQRSMSASVEPEITRQQRKTNVESVPKSALLESAENFHVVEKLKSEVVNLSKKTGILEEELTEAKRLGKTAEEERDKWRDRCESVEKECEKLRADFREKAEKNTELGKALTHKNEQIKKAETEREMLQNVSREKIETESKLREYMDKYGKLEAENRTLQNELMEKCGKLLKDLNESKDRMKTLEEENKTKAAELEATKRKHSIEEKKKSKEIEDLKKVWEDLKSDTNLGQQKMNQELEKLKTESEELRVAAVEATKMRNDLEEKERKVEELKKELSIWEGKKGDLEELELVRKERTLDREANERLKNELEALRGNLKGELKEKEEKSILVDKLTQECNLLMAEIENLKKTHASTENKLENELKMSRDECAIQRTALDNLKELFEDNRKTMMAKEKDAEEAKKRLEALAEENERLRETETTLNESSSTAEKMKRDLEESEKSRQEMSERIFKLTNDMNEAFGELQVKQGELETVRNSFKALQTELEEKVKAFEEERTRLASESENKLNVLKNEIKYINTRHEEDMGNFEENLNTEVKEATEKMAIAEKTSAELLDKLEKITSERDELKVADEEKNLKLAELENCMLALKAELDDRFNDSAKNDEENTRKHNQEVKEIVMQYDKEIAERDEEIEQLKARLEDAEGDDELKKKHEEEIREIIMKYDTEIAKRDEEIDALMSKCSDHETTLENLKSAKEELKKAKLELGEKTEINEMESKPDAEEAMSREKFEFLLEEERTRLDKEKERAVALEREIWETRLAAAVEKYQKLANSNSKVDVKVNPEVMEEIDLEPTLKTSLSSPLETGSTDVLEKQLIKQAEEMKELKKQYKKEIMELKKVSSKRKMRKNPDSSENQDWYYTCGGLENDTEHEYLRNILYEYMMGREQLVLAKVLSAIVKFNEEQTHNVLEKEQQRQTLLGQLGLL